MSEVYTIVTANELAMWVQSQLRYLINVLHTIVQLLHLLRTFVSLISDSGDSDDDPVVQQAIEASIHTVQR